jgi:hypothetical protein
MKKSLSTVSVLLICLMALSSVPVIFGNYASATTCAANFLPNYYVPYAGSVILDTANEAALSESVANYIVSVLSSNYLRTCIQ